MVVEGSALLEGAGANIPLNRGSERANQKVGRIKDMS